MQHLLNKLQGARLRLLDRFYSVNVDPCDTASHGPDLYFITLPVTEVDEFMEYVEQLSFKLFFFIAINVFHDGISHNGYYIITLINSLRNELRYIFKKKQTGCRIQNTRAPNKIAKQPPSGFLILLSLSILDTTRIFTNLINKEPEKFMSEPRCSLRPLLPCRGNTATP